MGIPIMNQGKWGTDAISPRDQSTLKTMGKAPKPGPAAAVNMEARLGCFFDGESGTIRVAQVTTADGLVHPSRPGVSTGWRVVCSAMTPGWPWRERSDCSRAEEA